MPLRWVGHFSLIAFLTSVFFSQCACVQSNVRATEPQRQRPSLIKLSDPKSVEAHRPIVVAHRGGVVSKRSPECSLTAIRLAAAQGYDMVELDIQISSDGIPIVFHDRSLKNACGTEGQVADRTAKQLELISYVDSKDRIVRLGTALELCHKLSLGVMLDLKAGRDSREFLQSINQLLKQNRLHDSTISISGTSQARRHLKHVRFTPTDDEMRRLRSGESLDLSNRFWFGLPHRLQPNDVTRLKQAGALVIPAINTFRYPASEHMDRARSDIKRLKMQRVDGFQIDSIYFPLIGKQTQQSLPIPANPRSKQ